MSIRSFLGLDAPRDRPAGPAAETETVRKIVEALDRLPPEQGRYIAAFAYVLSRVAHADLDTSREERREIEQLVMREGGLPEDQAILVVQMAKTQSLLFGGTENFLVTREFHRIASREQRLRLLRCLFAVAAADRSISGIEDREIRKIAEELKLEHKDFIAARLEFKDHLSVLQPRPDPPA